MNVTNLLVVACLAAVTSNARADLVVEKKTLTYIVKSDVADNSVFTIELHRDCRVIDTSKVEKYRENDLENPSLFPRRTGDLKDRPLCSHQTLISSKLQSEGTFRDRLSSSLSSKLDGRIENLVMDIKSSRHIKLLGYDKNEADRFDAWFVIHNDGAIMLGQGDYLNNLDRNYKTAMMKFIEKIPQLYENIRE